MEEGPLGLKIDTQTSQKAIQKPQQKRKMEKTKNKHQFDKENI